MSCNSVIFTHYLFEKKKKILSNKSPAKADLTKHYCNINKISVVPNIRTAVIRPAAGGHR